MSTWCRYGRKWRSCALIFFSTSTSLFAWSFDPYLLSENAIFKTDDSASTQDIISSLNAGASIKHEYKKLTYEFKGSYRLDAFDQRRDFFYQNTNALYYSSDDGNHEFSLGFKREQLGRLELFNTIDLLNDVVTDSINSEINRRGTPMITYRFVKDEWSLDFLALPYFINPYYPKNSSRFGVGLEFDQDLIVTGNDQTTTNPWQFNQGGIKIGYEAESFDLTFGYTRLIDRSLSLIALDEDLNFNRYFFSTDFYYLYGQKMIQDYLLKMNIFYKDFSDDKVETINLISNQNQRTGLRNHAGLSLGLEGKIDLITGHDTTWILEFQRFFGLDLRQRRQYSLFSEDVGYGFRHSFSDLKAQTIQIAHYIDLAYHQDQIVQADYSRLLTEKLKWQFGFRYINAFKRNDNRLNLDNLIGLNLIDDSDCLFTNFNYFF